MRVQFLASSIDWADHGQEIATVPYLNEGKRSPSHLHQKFSSDLNVQLKEKEKG
jgi:hypothetical protein